MSSKVLEQKVRELEKRLALLENKSARKRAPKNWRRAVGFAKNDDLFAKALDLGAAQRKKAGKAGA